jgi:hypothetical protein
MTRTTAWMDEEQAPPRPNGRRSAEIWIADGAWVEAELPLRRWVTPKYALRGAVTVIAGPPSVMKSSLMLAWGCAAASRRHCASSKRCPQISPAS